MNLPVTTPSIMARRHGYGDVEVTKYLDAFPRQHSDSLAAGFKFGYWGQGGEFSPENTSRPLRTCVGETKPGSKQSYISPALDEPYHSAVGLGARSRSPSRSTGVDSRADARSPSPQRQRSKSPTRSRAHARSLHAHSAAPEVPSYDHQMLMPPRTSREQLEQQMYADSLAQQNTQLDRALALERESRRVLERELREETRARKLLEGSLEEASVSFHRAKDRLRALGAENEAIRAANEELRSRFIALEQQVADLTLTCRHASQEVDRVVLEKETIHSRLREERQRRRDAEEDRQVLIDRFNDAVTRNNGSVAGERESGRLKARLDSEGEVEEGDLRLHAAGTPTRAHIHPRGGHREDGNPSHVM